MNPWYGYVHGNGTLHVKRFFSNEDYDEVKESPFVACVSNVFEAVDRDDALRKAQIRLPVPLIG